MIIFGLVTFASLLFFIVLLPAHNYKDLLINVSLSVPYAMIFLQLMYDKYDPNSENAGDQIRPIFWGQLSKFQGIRRSIKMAIVFSAMIVPILIIRLIDR